MGVQLLAQLREYYFLARVYQPRTKTILGAAQDAGARGLGAYDLTVAITLQAEGKDLFLRGVHL